MKHIHMMLLSLLVTGCSWIKSEPEPVPPVKVVKEQVPLAIYQPPSPAPIKLNDVSWIVVTRENLNQKIQEIEKITGNGFVIMAITPRDYENLAVNIQELKRYVREQRAIILYYREATKTTEDWTDLNNKKIEAQRQRFEAGKD